MEVLTDGVEKRMASEDVHGILKEREVHADE